MLTSLVANVPMPPSTFDGVTEAIAVFVLLLVFVMLRQALLHSQLRLYALQSLAVSALAAVLATSEHASDLFVLAGLSLVLKVIIVPIVILHLLREAEVDVAGSQRFGVASAVLLGVAISVSRSWLWVRSTSVVRERRASPCRHWEPGWRPCWSRSCWSCTGRMSCRKQSAFSLWRTASPWPAS